MDNPTTSPTTNADTTAPQAAEVTPTASAAPATTETAGESKGQFDLSSWKTSGGARSELPENMRSLYDHLSDSFANRDAFNAVKELRGMIESADKKSASGQSRQGVYEEQSEGQPDVEKQVQVRMAQLRNQQAVTQFRGDFESMLKEPISVGDGHTFAFAGKGELEKFVNYSRDVLQNGKITPQDLYRLWNFDRILADTGEWKARQHEEALRKTATGPRSSEQSATTKTSESERKSAGERNSNLTVEEIMKEKFPEIYGNMKAGNVRYG